MSEIDNNPPVVVTGDERRHPALRTLARACIALARLRLEQRASNEATGDKGEDDVEVTGAEQEGQDA